jgi:hypothetical protein
VPVDAAIAEPWKKGFRWQIPHLPSTDSVEFSFRAIDPPSDEYEVALYKSDRVILERSAREIERSSARWARRLGNIVGGRAISAASLALLLLLVFGNPGEKSSSFSGAGCSLMLQSSYAHVSQDAALWAGPWDISYRVLNIGNQSCVVRSDQLAPQPVTIVPGVDFRRSVYSIARPRLVPYEISFGAEGMVQKIQIEIYSEQK